MNVITRKQRAKDAPKRWAEVYGSNKWSDKYATTTALLQLSPQEMTPERIDEIIGNTSWTRVTCDECGEDVEVGVEIENR